MIPNSLGLPQAGFRLRRAARFIYYNAMKQLAILLFCAAVAFSSLTGCRVRDERGMTIDIPSLKTEADQEKVRSVVAPLVGIVQTNMVFDLQKHQLRLRYDSMQIAEKNIEIAIAEAGYDANSITAASAKQ